MAITHGKYLPLQFRCELQMHQNVFFLFEKVGQVVKSSGVFVSHDVFGRIEIVGQVPFPQSLFCIYEHVDNTISKISLVPIFGFGVFLVRPQ